jgi:hypothetical protein
MITIKTNKIKIKIWRCDFFWFYRQKQNKKENIFGVKSAATFCWSRVDLWRGFYVNILVVERILERKK